MPSALDEASTSCCTLMIAKQPCKCTSVAARRNPPRYELRILTKAGDCVHCEFLVVTKIREGSTERVMAIIRDITEQKQSEKNLEQADLMRRPRKTPKRPTGPKASSYRV